MSNEAIAVDLGFETAGHVLASVSGRGIAFAAVDRAAGLLWRSALAPDSEVERAVRANVIGHDEDEGGCFDLGDRGRIALAPIRDPHDSAIAWLVAWSEDESGVGSGEWKRTVETLPRVAAMLAREARMAIELSGAVSELADRYEELNVVFRIEREMRGADPHQDLVRGMLDGFLRHLHIDVGLLKAAGIERSLSARGTDREIANVDLVQTELEGRVWRFLAASRKPLVMNDLDDERRAYLLTNLPFKIMAIPSDGCGEPDSGLLLLRHFEAPDFTNSDMSLARVFFGQAMILLRNRDLIDRMESFTRQIASSLVETVEAKDPYTRGHSERVERITAGLGRSAGIDAKDFPDLLWGALLHDIGKIGIPDAILMKPGRLNEDEYNFIKTHPTRSYEIIRHVEALGPAALDGARYHQERFDGTGYPFGLVGVEIPLAARVVSVADTYDAVTSSRSYRPAMSHADGLRIVQTVAGTQLDPDLVRIFVDLVEQDEVWLDEIRPASPGLGGLGG